MERRKIAIITGGSRGLGGATALRFAELGYDVAFNYVNPAKKSKADAVADKIRALGQRAFYEVADVANEAHVAAFVSHACENLGDQIDVLVNNAGIAHGKSFMDSEISLLKHVVDVDLIGPMIMTKAVLPHMVPYKQGSLIFISSTAGIAACGLQSAYASSKAGVIGLMRSLTVELSGDGIRSNIVVPGPFNTDMNAGADQASLDSAMAKLPARRFGEPEELAKLIGDIVQNPFCWGQVYVCDGGQTINQL